MYSNSTNFINICKIYTFCKFCSFFEKRMNMKHIWNKHLKHPSEDLATADVVLLLYCTILYYTILYCIVLYCTVLYCIVLYCTVLYCTILLYYAILCYAMLYHTIPYYTLLYYTMLCYAMLYHTIPYHAILYCTMLYYTILLYYTKHTWPTRKQACRSNGRKFVQHPSEDLATADVQVTENDMHHLTRHAL